MPILNESSFYTVDLGALLKRQSANNSTNKPNNAGDNVEADEKITNRQDAGSDTATEDNLDDITAILNSDKEVPKDFDWDLVLRQVKPNPELTKKFWSLYFTEVFGAEMQKSLENIGTELKKDFENWELATSSKNPLIPFFKQKYIQSTLIKLIDMERYRAIHTAIVDKLMADAEFHDLKPYNVLYCKNLYKKSADKMIEYFKIQKTILYETKNLDPKRLINRNKRVLFDLGGSLTQGYSFEQKVEFQRNAQTEKLIPASVVDLTLNELDLARAILKKYKDYQSADSDKTAKNDDVSAINKTILDQAKKAGSYAPVAAALLHLATNLNNHDAAAALKQSPFADIKMSDTLDYFAKLQLTGLKINNTDANALVKNLIATKL